MLAVCKKFIALLIPAVTSVLLCAQLPGNQTAAPATTSTTPGESTQEKNPATAQTIPQVSAPALKVTTRLVIIDAVVTNSSGKPVMGLKASDFEVLEDGRPQVVRAFGAREPAASGRAVPAVKRVLPPGTFTNIPEFDPGNGPPTVVLIDALNTLAKDQPYMRQQLIKYLQNVGPNRNIAIYTLGSRLRLVQDFTSDPAVLQAAIQKLGVHTSLLNLDPASSPDATVGDSSDYLPDVVAQSLKDFQAEQNAALLDVRVRVTTDALKQLARNISGFPGRKNLVWLSGAFPFYVAPDSDLSNPFVSQRQYADEVHGAAIVLTDAQIAVYPVDSRGLVGSFLPDASVRGPSGRNPGAIVSQINKSSADLQNSQDAMNEIAKQTGGRAFYNRNDLNHAIALSVEDGSSYYSLGYYPENKQWNGKFRKVEIRLAQKGLQVRNRRGYFATVAASSPESGGKAADNEFKVALAPDSLTSTTLPVVAQVVLPAKPETSVVINFAVDPHSVQFVVLDDNLRHAKVDFVTLAFDGHGKLVTSRSEVLTTALKPETYANVLATRLGFQQKISLPPGKYTLKFGVRDQGTNLIGTVTAKIEVPPQP